MKSFTYPAVFVKDEENDAYNVLFPDLQLTTDGRFVEEAYLYAKACLKAYFVYVEKYDLDFNMPSDFEKVKASSKNDIVMLIDADVCQKDINK